MLVELGLKNGVEVWVEESGTNAYTSSLKSTGITVAFLFMIIVVSFILHRVWNGEPNKMLNMTQNVHDILSSRGVDTASLRRSLQAPFHGFVKFDNQNQQSLVKMAAERGDSSMVELDATALSLKTEDIEALGSNSFENPMFDSENNPEINIFSKCTALKKEGEIISEKTIGFENPAFNDEKFIQEREQRLIEVQIIPESQVSPADTDKLPSVIKDKSPLDIPENAIGFENPNYSTEICIKESEQRPNEVQNIPDNQVSPADTKETSSVITENIIGFENPNYNDEKCMQEREKNLDEEQDVQGVQDSPVNTDYSSSVKGELLVEVLSTSASAETAKVAAFENPILKGEGKEQLVEIQEFPDSNVQKGLSKTNQTHNPSIGNLNENESMHFQHNEEPLNDQMEPVLAEERIEPELTRSLIEESLVGLQGNSQALHDSINKQ